MCNLNCELPISAKGLWLPPGQPMPGRCYQSQGSLKVRYPVKMRERATSGRLGSGDHLLVRGMKPPESNLSNTCGQPRKPPDNAIANNLPDLDPPERERPRTIQSPRDARQRLPRIISTWRCSGRWRVAGILTPSPRRTCQKATPSLDKEGARSPGSTRLHTRLLVGLSKTTTRPPALPRRAPRMVPRGEEQHEHGTRISFLPPLLVNQT
jgi:hypothetical protein